MTINCDAGTLSGIESQGSNADVITTWTIMTCRLSRKWLAGLMSELVMFLGMIRLIRSTDGRQVDSRFTFLKIRGSDSTESDRLGSR